MRRTLLLVPVVALAACGTGGRADSGSGAPGPRVTRSFAAAGFDRVSLRGPDDVVVRNGPAAVSATGDQRVIDHLKIEVIDGELRIARERGDWGAGWGDHHATVTVTMPAIKAVSVAGSGDMTVDRIAGATIAAAISGSGDLAIAAAQAPAADLAVSGSGDLRIAGRADRVSLSVTGSGGIDAERLQSASASVSTVGSGDIVATVREMADVSLIGSGDVTIHGGARCSVTKIGSGEVDCAGQRRVASGDAM